MAVIRPEKTASIEEVKSKIKAAPISIFLDLRGLNVAQSNKLRTQLRPSNSRIRVVKNTLAQIASEQLSYKIEQVFTGNTSIVFSGADVVEPAKIIMDFTKEVELVKVKGALMDGRFLTPKDLAALSKLPGRQELIAKLVGGMKTPITKFVLQMGTPLRKLVYVLDAIKNQKQAA